LTPLSLYGILQPILLIGRSFPGQGEPGYFSMYALSLNVNLLDALMLCLIVRGYSVGSRTGLIAEALRLGSVVCSTFIVVQFYPLLAQFLWEYLFISDDVYEFAAFVLWMIFSFVIFFFIREGWLLLCRVDRKSAFNKWTGAILSLVTSYFLCGLIFLAFVLLNNDFVHQQIDTSLSRAVWGRTSADLYKASYQRVVRPLFPGEQPNPRVMKLVEEPPGD